MLVITRDSKVLVHRRSSGVHKFSDAWTCTLGEGMRSSDMHNPVSMACRCLKEELALPIESVTPYVTIKRIGFERVYGAWTLYTVADFMGADARFDSEIILNTTKLAEDYWEHDDMTAISIDKLPTFFNNLTNIVPSTAWWLKNLNLLNI